MAKINNWQLIFRHKTKGKKLFAINNLLVVLYIWEEKWKALKMLLVENEIPFMNDWIEPHKKCLNYQMQGSECWHILNSIPFDSTILSKNYSEIVIDWKYFGTNLGQTAWKLIDIIITSIEYVKQMLVITMPKWLRSITFENTFGTHNIYQKCKEKKNKKTNTNIEFCQFFILTNLSRIL